jgi:preprotein translocase subunit SecA
LVQIGTGEGKSITLGVTSTILALLGFHVSCACYSSYLSERDFESFKYIFTAFGVE